MEPLKNNAIFAAFLLMREKLSNFYQGCDDADEGGDPDDETVEERLVLEEGGRPRQQGPRSLQLLTLHLAQLHSSH